MADNPYFKNLKYLVISANAKYKERSPRIAKTFEVYTINVSFDIARIAGIESTAKIRSVNSISNNTINKGVAKFLAPTLTKISLHVILSLPA